MTTKTKVWTGGGVLAVALLVIIGWLVFRDDDSTQANSTTLTEEEVRDMIQDALNGVEASADETPATGDSTSPSAANPASGDGNQALTGNGPCRLEKDGTWSEGNDAFRIEVGGHGGEHADLYPAPGVKSISYIVDPFANPEGVPDIYFGYGSIWSGDSAECQGFDWLADATQYATARLDSGHSGLVLEWGTWEVLANVNNMNDDEIFALTRAHSAAMNGEATAQSTNPTQSQSAPANCDSIREDHQPVVGKTWTLTGPALVNFWTNEPGKDQTERKLLVPAGVQVSLHGGGAAWTYPTGCNIGSDFAANNLPEVTLDELVSDGLAT